MSRAQPGVSQWPVVGLQLCVLPATHPVDPQPGTQAPPEQMVLGAPTHSESVLHKGPPSGSAGQPGRGSRAQPATQVCIATLQTTAGGSHIESSVQGVPPTHSPLAGSQVAAPVHRSVSMAQPETQ
jgi:hypothetical protein